MTKIILSVTAFICLALSGCLVWHYAFNAGLAEGVNLATTAAYTDVWLWEVKRSPPCREPSIHERLRAAITEEVRTEFSIPHRSPIDGLMHRLLDKKSEGLHVTYGRHTAPIMGVR